MSNKWGSQQFPINSFFNIKIRKSTKRILIITINNLNKIKK